LDKVLLRKFILQLNKLEGKEYLLSAVAYKAAPTLDRVKPSSLMSFSVKNRNLYEVWERYKYDVCESLGLRFFELKEAKDWKLVLFYNEEMLEKTTVSKGNQAFLKKMGYEEAITLPERLEILKMRFKWMCPHEIGVFLGIPIEDVYGFMQHKGNNFIFCSKYWKVYHNPEEAQNLFECYDKAKAKVIYSIINKDLSDNLAV
jgi:hypothetical protein